MFSPDDEYTLRIGGKAVRTDSSYDIVDPADGSLVGRAPEGTVEHAREAAATARAALESWAATPMAERCAMLAAAGDALEAASADLVDLVQAETGATMAVSRGMQLPVAVQRFRGHSTPVSLDRAIVSQLTPTTQLAAGGVLSAEVVRQPVGVVAAITSYNFPLVNLVGKIAPALMMGNTVVMKPAPQDPLAIVRLAEILDGIFPAGVVNVVTGSGPQTGAALVESPDVDMVSFTGSTEVGVKIVENGARTMKRTLLELGGKGACVVLDDADLDAAVTAISSTWTFHSGQICTAPTRVIARREVYAELLERLTAVANSLVVGSPRDPATVVGPLISTVQRDRVEAFVRRGVDEGARLLAGGERPDAPGCLVAPTLLADVDPGMWVTRNEAFGPVVVAMPCDDDDHAVRQANDSPFGLYSYVFTGDVARGHQLARRLRSGSVGVNTVQPHHEAPFGGFGMSGIGRDRGIAGLEAYSEVQAIAWQ